MRCAPSTDRGILHDAGIRHVGPLALRRRRSREFVVAQFQCLACGAAFGRPTPWAWLPKAFRTERAWERAEQGDLLRSA